jgi:hypothetical protein
MNGFTKANQNIMLNVLCAIRKIESKNEDEFSFIYAVLVL